MSSRLKIKVIGYILLIFWLLMLTTPISKAWLVSEPFTPKEQLPVKQETLKTGWTRLFIPNKEIPHVFIQDNSITMNKNNQRKALLLAMYPTVGGEKDEDMYAGSAIVGITADCEQYLIQADWYCDFDEPYGQGNANCLPDRPHMPFTSIKDLSAKDQLEIAPTWTAICTRAY